MPGCGYGRGERRRAEARKRVAPQGDGGRHRGGRAGEESAEAGPRRGQSGQDPEASVKETAEGATAADLGDLETSSGSHQLGGNVDTGLGGGGLVWRSQTSISNTYRRAKRSARRGDDLAGVDHGGGHAPSALRCE